MNVNHAEEILLRLKRGSILGKKRLFWLFLVVVIGIASYRGAEVSPVNFVLGIKNIAIYTEGFFPPDFSRIGIFTRESLVSLSIAIWGSLIAFVFSIPLALLASRNVSPNLAVYHLFRRILDILRAVNELVFALMFVAAVGLGPFAGVLALAVHTTGVVGKLISEAVEGVDKGQVEAITATGAGKLHIISFGIIPQIMPSIVSFNLYRFEANVRSATIVGFCGAGGIGYQLWEAMRSFEQGQVFTILLLMVVMVSFTDYFCAFARKVAS
ncbi:MAG: phosphonate ABC transporter, permease protein PhnE [Syntrophales bacterium]|nr:phosphonate ABC transporter, permease protein PhnE [Syntrophales bacterium]